jgi:hypothetical protein
MSTRLIRFFVYALTLTILVPSVGWTQDFDDDDDDDGPTVAAHLQLIGGITDAAERAPMFAGAIGLRVSFIEFDVEVGHFTDVLAKNLLDALNEYQRERGLPIQAIAEVPATYALGTLRLIPGAGPIRPFLSVGGGVARLRPRLNIVVEGISLGDLFGLAVLGSINEPMATAGAGIRIDPGRVHFELGYRFVAVFTNYRGFNISANGATYVNNFYGALGVRF